jgi:hypothetical protein
LDAVLEDDLLALNFDGLKKVDGRSDLGDFHYLPVLFHEGSRVRKAERLLLAALAWLNLVLLIVRVLIDLPSADEVVDQKIGAFVGLAFALALALGATESLREQVAADRALGRAG